MAASRRRRRWKKKRKGGGGRGEEGVQSNVRPERAGSLLYVGQATRDAKQVKLAAWFTFIVL